MVAILVSCRGDVAVDSGPWFEDLVGVRAPPEDRLEAVVRCLQARILGGEPCDFDGVNDDGPRIVFLSLADGEASTRVLMARGRGLGEVASRAFARVESLGMERDFEQIKVDFVSHVGGVTEVGRRGRIAFERGFDGLAFEGSTGVAFLPGEVVARTLVNSDREIRARNIEKYLRSSESGRVGVVERLWKDEAARVRTFRTRSFFADGTRVVSLERGHRRFHSATADELMAAALSAGRYLRQAVTGDGSFVYSYLPKTDRIKDEYNILRHSGSVYSMLELYQTAGDEELLHAAERALEFLRSQVQSCSAGAGSAETLGACVVEDGYVKLGGNALAVLALAKYMEVSGDRSDLPLIQSLGRWMTSTQDEIGEFRKHKLHVASGRVDDFVSGYYPGEALFALVRLHQLDRDSAWLDAAEAGAGHLIEVRDDGLTDSELSHDHWLLYALNELHRFRPQQLYLDHALRLARVIVASQNREPEFPDWRGSYYRPPRSTPTATRTEGLCAAYELATRTGRARAAEEILEAIRLGIDFQLQTQFGSESALYLSDPGRVLGGFHRSLTDFEIRIDYVQHNLSSLLFVHRILSDRARLE